MVPGSCPIKSRLLKHLPVRRGPSLAESPGQVAAQWGAEQVTHKSSECAGTTKSRFRIAAAQSARLPISPPNPAPITPPIITVGIREPVHWLSTASHIAL
jgi:hypothetical protein